ncbi:hypothetical protein [Enterococcus sp. AZ196]|uniref:hypothetical protein n=1 Tax=Enterococcus sp. AZ196 TaxID=2774659 RepID=UPI003D27CC38
MINTLIGMKEFLFKQMYGNWYWSLYLATLISSLFMTLVFLLGALWVIKENHDRYLDGVNGRARNRSFVFFNYYLVLDGILMVILYFAYTISG